jgi:hypothetical protein
MAVAASSGQRTPAGQPAAPRTDSAGGGHRVSGEAQDTGTRKPAGSGGSLLGVELSPTARAALLGVLLAIGAGALLVTLVIADNLGLGPRRRLLRRRRSQQLF